MPQPWLLLDVSYLAYRAFFTTGHLSFRDVKTGVIYGLMRDIVDFQKRFETENVAFCFDSKHSLRKEIRPEYKSNRKKDKLSKEEYKALQELKRQIKQLRRDYLPKCGFSNIFIQKGYEADDLIAETCISNRSREIIIVSADSDLYQMLSDRVQIWNPTKQKLLTPEWLWDQHRCKPSAWYLAKAIAGDPGDNIEGVKGVGLKTACKHIYNLSSEKMREKIHANLDLIEENKQLILLPFKGCRVPELQPNNVTPKKWQRVMKQLGIESLDVPYSPRPKAAPIKRRRKRKKDGQEKVKKTRAKKKAKKQRK